MKKRIYPLFALIVLMATLFWGAKWILPQKTSIEKYAKEIHLEEKKSGMKHIDAIYVINLDKRPDRWAYIQNLLQEKKLFANRVSGVNGWELTKEDREILSGPYPDHLRGGEYGCLLSHFSIFRDAYLRGFERIWILEDDVEIFPDYIRIPDLIEELNSLDSKWDIFYTDIDTRNYPTGYLTSTSVEPRPKQKVIKAKYLNQRKKISKNLMTNRNRFGNYSIILSKRGIKKLYSYFLYNYIYKPIDYDIHYIPGIREYSPTWDIVTNPRDDSGSDTKPFSAFNR